MQHPVPFRRPINWRRLRTDEAEAVVRQRAADTSNVVIGEHAFERLAERGEGNLIITPDVYEILRTGIVEPDPVLEPSGEWKVVVVKRMAGAREAGAVTLFAQEDGILFVKTVEWMDWIR